MRKFLTTIAAVALTAAALPTSAQEAELTPDQVRGLALQLAQNGEVAEAAGLAEALIARDPKDLGALILLAEIAAAIGNFPQSAAYAARAYRATEGGEQSYYTARLAARAHAEQQQDTRAQFWLRRARQYAPNETESNAVAEDFRFLRTRNPLSFQLRFGVTPSSNINNGSVSDTTEIFVFGQTFVSPLDNEARALSGLEFSGSANLSYRIAESENFLTTAHLDFSGRTYALSATSRDGLEEDFADRCASFGTTTGNCAPNVPAVQTGSDFSDASLSFGLSHARRFAPGMSPVTLRADVGQTWYGGEAFTRFSSFSLSQPVPISERSAFNIAIGYTLTQYLDDPRNADGSNAKSDQLTTVNASWSHLLPSEDLVRLTLGWRDSQSVSTNRDYTSVSVGGSYSLNTPVAGINFGLGLNYEERTYDIAALAGGNPRYDYITSARVTAQFGQIEYYGFQPVVSVDASRALSNIDLYDRDSVSLGFDLVSSF